MEEFSDHVAGGYLEAEEPWRSHSLLLILLAFTGSLHGTWFQKTRVLALVYGSIPTLSSLHKCSGRWLRKSAYLEKAVEGKPPPPRKGYTNPDLLPNFFSKDMRWLVFQLLFPAKVSLISFIKDKVWMGAWSEKHIMVFQRPNHLSHTPSLGHMNGVWRRHSDTFQLTTTTKTS